jgi:hypothetical protein
MMQVESRIMLDFDSEFPESILKHPLVAVLNEINDVYWDINVVSHGSSSRGGIHRTVEIIIYHDDDGDRHKEAKVHIINWIKQNKLKYYSLSADVI